MMIDSNLKCCILARVSTEMQSLDSQINKLVDEAHRMGYTDNDITIISGKESAVKLDIEERHTIQQMKECIETGQYDMVLIWEVSRLARRPKVLYEVREYLIDHNVNLRCMTPSFTLLKSDGAIDPTASIVFALFGTMAEEEARLSKERMNRGRLAKRDKGYFIGGNILFGYMTDEQNKIIENKEASPIVKRIFEMYIDGHSIRQIARDLVDEGKLPYRDYATAQVMLKRMIRRTEYAGIKQGSYDYPAIISEDLFNKARERAEKRNKYKNRTKRIYWCQGKIIDKDTKLALSPMYLLNTYRIWREDINRGYQINMNMIDSLALYTVKKHFLSMSGTRRNQIISDLNQKKFNLHDKIIKGRDNMKAAKQKIEKINERIINGKMTEELGDKMLSNVNTEIESIRINLLRWNSEEAKINIQISNIGLNEKIVFESMNDQEIQNFIREHVDQIQIEPIYENKKMTKDRNIYIILKDGYEYKYISKKHGVNFEILYCTLGNEYKKLKDFIIIERFKRNRK